MDTSELLRTPLTVCLVVLTLLLAFLAANRIRNKLLRTPVRVTCSVGAVLIGLLLAFMLFARGKPTETISETKNGSFKVLVRSQEFHHSGVINVDVCVANSSDHEFPKNEKAQCFLHGFDFSGLSVKWVSGRDVEVAFDNGRVTDFTNSALVYRNGPVPVEFHTTLRDGFAKQVP